MDSLLSIVQMPPGVPVAAVAINGAKKCRYIGYTDTGAKV